MQFIELTEIIGNQEKKRWFNSENIQSMQKQDAYTVLFMSANDAGFKIKESPEQIIKLINKTKESKRKNYHEHQNL